MENQSLISVIIPVYNVEKYLRRCLESVINNTYKNIEIICINDGSTDSSLNILEEYANADSRIIIIDQENKKLSVARNAGLDAAQGEWVALIDSDDWVHFQYFEVLVNIGVKENADIVICDSLTTPSTSVDDKPLETNKLQYKIITKKELNKNHLGRSRVWAKLYRRSTIGEHRFIPGAEPVEDNCFNTALYSTKMKYCFVGVPLYYYYVRDDSALRSYSGKKSLVYLKYMLPVIEEEQDSEKREDMVQRCYNILLSARYMESFATDYRVFNRELKLKEKSLKKHLKNLSLKQQIIYIVLWSNPWLYRLWRIHNDPTLLENEKRLKTTK